ncbi:MAG: methyltransferase domain-containing protein [Bacteroidota bacterium]
MAKTEPFDKHLQEYEKWFEDNHYAFLSELEAVRKLLPLKGKGVEIGVGSGVFAAPLGIEEGCDPSKAMREKAIARGIKAINCVAEKLPYEDESFDYALMVTTICFVDDPGKAISEINRILKPRGELIIGFVDRNSQVGKQYLKEKDKSLFYKDASFFSTKEIHDMLKENDFIIGKTVQTVFGSLGSIKDVQQVKNGQGKGSFIVTRAIKKVKKPLRFAMAVDSADNFDIKQFCFAWRFLVYEWKNNEFTFIKELINPFRDENNGKQKGKEEKGKEIINLLKENKVSVLVARNFGVNIGRAAKNFIPVIVFSETPDEVKTVLTKYLMWLKDELQNRPKNYRLFTIKQGILKTSVHKRGHNSNEV